MIEILSLPGAGVLGGGDWANNEFLALGRLSTYKRHGSDTESSLAADARFDGPHGTSVIFCLCTVMYGSVAVAWVMYMALVPNRKDTSLMHTGMLCISWASCSIGMIVLNKHLAVALEAPALIAMAQMALCFGATAVVSGKELLVANRKQLAYWMTIPLFFAGMLCTSIYTVQYISISLFTVIRNLMPLVTLPMETLAMPVEKQPKVNVWIVLSLCVTLVGAIMYAQGLKSVSILGVTFAFVNMGITVCDRVLQRRLLTQECKDLHVVVCTMVTNLFGMLPCIVLAFATTQISELPKHRKHWTDIRIIAMLCLSGVVSIGIGALGFEVQRRLSATSFLIMQNVSKIVVVFIGVLVFGDTIKSPLAGSGLLVSLLGSFMYSRMQMKVSAEEKPLVAKLDAKA